jgi:Tfp pilus assembly protein PilZ
LSDVMTTARSARESLARALAALQADPNVPPALLDLAAPIAQAMGSLMNVERTGQLVPYADAALTNVRTALQSLQQQTSLHPAVGQAMEAVASSLGQVHALWRMAQPEGAPATAPPPAPLVPPPPAFVQQAAPAPPPVAVPAVNHAPPLATNHAAAPRGAGAHADGAVVNAELGTQSATNFYKGLSGNDIIDHGGLFVSTYMVPKIGAHVRLKISLPGGYEFEANAVVAWSREDPDSGGDAPPGFGAKFTEITPEARQLIYRYVRNREPLFHDDL